MVVRPGQVFDFWNALGEVSFRTGYRLGGAIVGGHSVEGKALAGGICAASTTLFNAAARGGLEIVTRSPHWYYITRYPLGLDATVSGSQSMRFRNDTSHPILIKSYAIARQRPVRDLERAERPDGVVEPAERQQRRAAATTRSRTPRRCRAGSASASSGRSMARTSRSRARSGTPTGASSIATRFVSHYHRMVGITLVGTG